jgi:hypothetical protein
VQLRLQTTPTERREFAECLARARASKGLGFSETPLSVLGEIHLTYGQVWALFDEEGMEPDQMLGGFIIHNLAMFPQSYPRPDLSYLAPESVVECGELWALAPGAARIARHAGFILGGLINARAILAYVMIKPRDTSFLYKNFSRVGDPINSQYTRALDGSEVWAQPMVLEGLALEMTVQVATAVSYESFDGRCLQFRNPFPIVPRINRRIPRQIPGLEGLRASGRVLQVRR